MTPQETSELLELAGRMADAAIALTGGQGFYGYMHPATISEVSVLSDRLRKATEAYNAAILVLAEKYPEPS